MRRIWDLTDDEIRISARLRNDHTDLPGLYVFRDGSWIAYCDLPGGTGCGPTPEDAVAEMREFIAERLKPRLSKEQIRKARDELKMLMGLPPYNNWSNICYGDGYFAQSLVQKYGMSIQELKQETKMLRDEAEFRRAQDEAAEKWLGIDP